MSLIHAVGPTDWVPFSSPVPIEPMDLRIRCLHLVKDPTLHGRSGVLGIPAPIYTGAVADLEGFGKRHERAHRRAQNYETHAN